MQTMGSFLDTNVSKGDSACHQHFLLLEQCSCAPPGWLSGEGVRLMAWWLSVQSPVEVTFLQKHARKVVGGFGKKSCVSAGVRKPGNTYASLTAMI